MRGEELPAQWQKYPLTTQRELMRGRDSLKDEALWRWADEGEKWLREKFPGDIVFHTAANVEERTITLKVSKRVQSQAPLRSYHYETVFEVTEPAESFVSHATVTKIILIAG